jgi:hypothetical protein
MWFAGINYYKLAVEKDRDSLGKLKGEHFLDGEP